MSEKLRKFSSVPLHAKQGVEDKTFNQMQPVPC